MASASVRVFFRDAEPEDRGGFYWRVLTLCFVVVSCNPGELSLLCLMMQPMSARASGREKTLHATWGSQAKLLEVHTISQHPQINL